MAKKLWWHVYTGIVDDAIWGDDLRCTFIIGGSDIPPEEMRGYLKHDPALRYAGSFDHDLTDEERKTLTFERRRG